MHLPNLFRRFSFNHVINRKNGWQQPGPVTGGHLTGGEGAGLLAGGSDKEISDNSKGMDKCLKSR